KAYANHYLYTASVTNNAEYRVSSLSLKLTLNMPEKLITEKSIKLHLLPKNSKKIKVYFESDKPSQKLNENISWKVEIVTIRSK
ncbi:MAG: hypothetical protein HQL46_16585, partial [Gammaproteobacteria bacterium]|nr:hypothetical protein [Gammaproteobacteria bacterium]